MASHNSSPDRLSWATMANYEIHELKRRQVLNDHGDQAAAR